MTALQIVETGEVINEMTEEEASSITTRISVGSFVVMGGQMLDGAKDADRIQALGAGGSS